jgi:hypothetical protein
MVQRPDKRSGFKGQDMNLREKDEDRYESNSVSQRVNIKRYKWLDFGTENRCGF